MVHDSVPEDPKKPKRKLAILAVHGIAKHPAGETQNSIADVLLSLPTDNPHAARSYHPFRTVGIQIPLQPVLTGAPKPPPKKFSLWDIYDERSADFAKCLPLSGAGREAVGSVSTAYTDLLLSHYEGGMDSNAYITARLEGRRIDDGPDVDIYEVLWSDLAKPNNTILSFFLALFQLILHLASLSRTAIDTGAAETTGKVWKIYRRVQRYAVRMLEIFIPLVEIVLFIAITSCFLSITGSSAPAVPILLGGLGLTGLAFLILSKGSSVSRFGPWPWAILALLPGAVGSGIAYALMCILDKYSHNGADKAASLLWWLIPGAAFLYWLLASYEQIRSGAKFTGWLIFCASLCLFAYFVVQPSVSVELAAFWVAKLLLAAVRACWALLLILAVTASLLGSFAWRRSWSKGDKEHNTRERDEQRARARAAVRTSRLALALPAVMFLLITLLLWKGFTELAAKEIGRPIFSAAVVKTDLPCFWHRIVGRLHLLPTEEFDTTTSDPTEKLYVGNMLAWSVGYQLPSTLILLGLSIFLLVWWVLPSVLTERFPTRNRWEPPRYATNRFSVHMGAWLSRGLDATAVVTLLLWCSVFLAPAVYVILDHFIPGRYALLQWFLDFQKNGTKALVLGYGTIGTAILAALAKSGQNVLGIVLDVDTYLRASPVDATPRAKIFERYISTLRYLNDPKHGYEEILIVAHSLGALISGDLLHYVHAKQQERLRVPMTLITVGNPTRQLLNRFFPYLYDWVRLEPDNGLHPLPSPIPHRDAPASISNTDLPDPKDLGLTHWMSAYRSGDYVGRSLWIGEWFWRTKPNSPAGIGELEIFQSADGARSEVCIGAGAHTHYLDDTAREIAWILDYFVQH